MPTTYTSLLGFALPATGELSGTWGDTVNNYITQYVDAAVAGAQIISGSQTAVTLSVTNGSSLVSAGAGATGSSQYAIIRCTGNPASLLTVTAPAANKVYLVINATSTSQSVKVVGTGPTTGVTVAASRAALIAWNGSDFVLIATTDITQLSGTLAVANGGTGATTAATARTNLGATTAGGNFFTLTNPSAITFPRINADNTVSALDAATFRTAIGAGTGAGTVTSVAMTVPTFLSVSGTPVTSSGTLAVTLSGTALPVANGGTGATSLTANNVLLGNGTTALQVVAPGTNGNVLTSNGTTWQSTALPANVSSLNGQTGSITNTSVDVIGSYIVALYVSGSHPTTDSTSVSIGSTVAGSTLRYGYSGGDATASGDLGGPYNGGSYLTSFTTYGGGGTSMSGTWRCVGRPGYGWDAAGTGKYSWNPGLFVRVS